MIKDYLIKNEIISSNEIELFRVGTRDNSDLKVFKAQNSGILFIDEGFKISKEYHTKSISEFGGSKDLDDCIKKSHLDSIRRVRYVDHHLNPTKCLDYGTGCGGFLVEMSKLGYNVEGLEIQQDLVSSLVVKGFKIWESIDELIDESYDLITLFHVLEHISNPIELLTELKNKLVDNGVLLIEVPHSNDVLISKYNCESFIKHTLWSEHVMLHSIYSLEAVIKKAGFQNYNIEAIQRYSLTNHIYWLSKGKPNGHNIWSNMENDLLNKEYEKMLIKNKNTDTLFAVLRKSKSVL